MQKNVVKYIFIVAISSNGTQFYRQVTIKEKITRTTEARMHILNRTVIYLEAIVLVIMVIVGIAG